MTTERVKCKLTAILSADFDGYGRLMGEDEVGTVRTSASYQEIMGNLMQQHRFALRKEGLLWQRS